MKKKPTSLKGDCVDSTPEENIFLMNDLIKNLGEPKTTILNMRRDGYTFDEIVSKLHIRKETCVLVERGFKELWNK